MILIIIEKMLIFHSKNQKPEDDIISDEIGLSEYQ